ncbi:MAG: ComF family protein [Alphaproteobacteria bacterium]|jgi:ComF family protein|nr:ComF family protein [Alphaproteobacteria bacterium]
MIRTAIQSLVEAVYPPQCVMCDARTAVDFSLCGACWRDTPFIEGLTCDACGCLLPGQPGEPGESDALCDDCLRIARPWTRGRAAFAYRDLGRRLVLRLKHGDRIELARAAAPWLLRAARPIWSERPALVPVPLHWRRLAQRKFNQSAVLAQQLSQLAPSDYVPDALQRSRATAPLDGHDRDARFRALAGAIRPHPQKGAQLEGRQVIIIDDVMTSGATFAATTEACLAAGASEVCVLALARVTKDA